MATLQHLLEAEEAQPLLTFAIKGERACMDRFLASVESGAVTPRQLRDSSLLGGFPFSGYQQVLLIAATATSSRAAMLRHFASAEEIARIPPQDQHGALTRLEETAKNMPMAARMLTPSLLRLATTSRHSQARLRMTLAALAAERYRRGHGDWPSAIEGLVPGFLASVPTNPSNGKPLRLRRLGDGVAIDSVAVVSGPGARRSSRPTATPSDLPFRLWDPPDRHQPPKP